MRIKREIKIVAGIIIFLTVFYLLSPAHESLLRLLGISTILLLTFLTFIATRKLGARLSYGITLLVAFISAMLVGHVLRGEFISPKYGFIFLMLLLLAIISPYLMKLVRFESKQELTARDLLKIILLAVIIAIYAFGITLISYWF